MYHEFYPCEESDFEKFDKPHPSSYSKLELFKTDGGLYCLDWETLNLKLSGTWVSSNNFKAIDVMMVPCGMTYTLYNGEEATIRDDCIYEKQKVIDYLGLL